MWGVWRWRDVHVRVCVHVGGVEVEGCTCEGVCACGDVEVEGCACEGVCACGGCGGGGMCM